MRTLRQQNMFYEYSQNLTIASEIVYQLRSPEVFDILYGFMWEFYHQSQHGAKLIMFGNGGSAADCDHIVGEFMNRFLYDRKPVMAMGLATSVATVTAIGNDFDYNQVFSRQLDGIVNPNDSIIALSTSGRSKNVINALDSVNSRFASINSLIITGSMSEELPGYKYHIRIPIQCTKFTVARIQEATMFLLHSMCGIFDTFWNQDENDRLAELA